MKRKIDIRQTVAITTVPIGYKKTLFVPLDINGKTSTAIGFFVKEEGEFSGDIFVQDLSLHIPETEPVVAFNFKNKSSINAVIKFLRFYRDNIFKKDFKNPTKEEKNGRRKK